MENSTTLNRILTNATKYDLNVHSESNTDNGWKISIQGKEVSDSIFLYDKLSSYLMGLSIPFKVATDKRYSVRSTHKEQSFKAMTIYCPNGMDIMSLCEEVYSLTMDYKGSRDINTPTSYEHYAGGLFFRNDRDEVGGYVPAN